MSTAGAWETHSRRLRESAEYGRLLERLSTAGPASVRRLPVPAAAWVTELLAADLARPVLVLLPHGSDVVRWVEAATLFSSAPLYFPAPSLTSYQQAEPSLLVQAQESAVVDAVLVGRARVVVTTPLALFRRLPVAGEFAAAAQVLTVGDEVSMEDLIVHLDAHGYRRVDLVSDIGEFAVRGGVLDLFPAGADEPLRLDFFGDTLDSLRVFEATSQRSRDRLETARVPPLTLFRADGSGASRMAELLAEWLGPEIGFDAAQRLEDLRSRGGFPGWTNYLHLLADASGDLTDLFPEALIVTFDPGALEAAVAAHERALASDFAAARAEGRLAVPPDVLEQPPERVREVLSASQLRIDGLGRAPADLVDFGAVETDLLHRQLPRFPREVETARARGEHLLLVGSVERRHLTLDLCRTYGLELGPGGVELVDGELQRGFRLPPAGVVLFGEDQLFARVAPRRRPRRPRFGPFVTGLRDLRVGDYVVHLEHGIGQFVGLRAVGPTADPASPLPDVLEGTARPSEAETEVMEIAYSGDRSLLLPLSRLDQIQKYSGVEGIAPRVDRLGGTSWARAKDRVRRGMRQLAGDLLKLYAQRQMAAAPAMPEDSDLQAQFEAAFEYEETPDQLEATAAIKEDLERTTPMDRLLCGDVGFGKTEVAMRAAFKVVAGGYQVAVLAPTTILADQHLETFTRRLAGFPVRAEMVSRFRSPQEVREIRERLARSEIDILIGTHRLLSRDIELRKLGLLIVDEEQRFGVAQKERLKQLRQNVHVLAMSATPVPRTLQLSLAGVRDLSVIETPPRDRSAVETAIVPFSQAVVREAIEFELDRGGQIYYVYNRVESIDQMATQLRDLVPAIRLTVGHGQMGERELARRMHAFKAGEFDLLLASTIIENGIDISNVNTMLVHRADRFGLAQLYQLRGRVGRSDQLAYCYLLVPAGRELSAEARQRLAAIREFTELGAGFRIAARDLEIRGAGNLLGAEQSGHIASVGLETYLKMLEDTVRELKGEAVEEAPSANLQLPVPATIPEEYVGDANLRMELYGRIALGDQSEEELLSELRDRFGAPPESVCQLVAMGALKRQAEDLRIQSISGRGKELQIRLRRDARIDVDRLIELVSRTVGAAFSPGGVLSLSGVPPAEMIARTRAVLSELSEERLEPESQPAT